jgi:hypothetical protein
MTRRIQRICFSLIGPLGLISEFGFWFRSLVAPTAPHLPKGTLTVMAVAAYWLPSNPAATVACAPT